MTLSANNRNAEQLQFYGFLSNRRASVEDWPEVESVAEECCGFVPLTLGVVCGGQCTMNLAGQRSGILVNCKHPLHNISAFGSSYKERNIVVLAFLAIIHYNVAGG